MQLGPAVDYTHAHANRAPAGTRRVHDAHFGIYELRARAPRKSATVKTVNFSSLAAMRIRVARTFLLRG